MRNVRRSCRWWLSIGWLPAKVEEVALAEEDITGLVDMVEEVLDVVDLEEAVDPMEDLLDAEDICKDVAMADDSMVVPMVVNKNLLEMATIKSQPHSKKNEELRKRKAQSSQERGADGYYVEEQYEDTDEYPYEEEQHDGYYLQEEEKIKNTGVRNMSSSMRKEACFMQTWT